MILTGLENYDAQRLLQRGTVAITLLLLGLFVVSRIANSRWSRVVRLTIVIGDIHCSFLQEYLQLKSFSWTEAGHIFKSLDAVSSQVGYNMDAAIQ
jgi:hypothetical protein